MYLPLSPRDTDSQVTAECASSGLDQVFKCLSECFTKDKITLFVSVQLLCSITTAKWGHGFSCLTSIVHVNVSLYSTTNAGVMTS